MLRILFLISLSFSYVDTNYKSYKNTAARKFQNLHWGNTAKSISPNSLIVSKWANTKTAQNQLEGIEKWMQKS